MGRIISNPYRNEYISQIVYNAKDIREILNISEQAVSRLLIKKPFPIVIAVRKKVVPIESFNKWLRITHPKIYEKQANPAKVFSQHLEKKSYSVPEIQKMLGIGKTSSYEFVKSKDIETIRINEHIRVTKKSFDEWLHSQDKHFKD